MSLIKQDQYYAEQDQYPQDQYYDQGQPQFYEDADIGGGYHPDNRATYQSDGPYDYNQDGYEDYPVDAYPADTYDPRLGPAAGQQPTQYYGEGQGHRGMCSSLEAN